MIERSKVFGSSEVYVKQACEFLDHREHGLCFDTVVMQLYESDLAISDDYYNLIGEIANKMDVEMQYYSFMESLIAKN
ncbi:MafI family immunity protein [Mucilaginibacter auburnensis]|uniref:MafI family immunity protein n=1 Tax=Mucilaginibacter auburnensis TaxID=1457233 RepID=A0A2H9VPJ2_9SPHI|nr:MafI family immunity protein [Mucilaginibacter auburnensis]PJJ80279.1 hypothetical protein CLV57_3428 [Mucilaginibacter auburnensis]